MSIRKFPHEGQKIKGNIENITYKFLRECIYKRMSSHINDNIECIINIDETPCYLEMPGTETINIKGKKH